MHLLWYTICICHRATSSSSHFSLLLLSLLSQSFLVFFLCISRAQTMHLERQSLKLIILFIHWAPFWGFAQIPACRLLLSLSLSLSLLLLLLLLLTSPMPCNFRLLFYSSIYFAYWKIFLVNVVKTGIGQSKYCIPQPFSRCLDSFWSSLFDFNLILLLLMSAMPTYFSVSL